MDRILVSAFLFCVQLFTLGAQDSQSDNFSKKLSPEALAQDLNILRRVLEEAHPALYLFTTKSTFDEKLAEVTRELADSLTEIEFYRKVSEVISVIHEGHTWALPSVDYQTHFLQHEALFPFELTFLEQRAFVTKSPDSSASYLPSGTEITTINGRSVEEILRQLSEIANFSTGFNQANLLHDLSIDFNFAVAYGYFFGISDVFELTYTLPGSAYVNRAEFEGIINPYPGLEYPAPIHFKKPHFRWEIEQEKNLAIISIAPFTPWDKKIKRKDWLKLYKRAFKEIEGQGINHLILDVRDNPGGDAFLSQSLLRYLLPEPFVPIAFNEVRTLEIASIRATQNPDNFKLKKYHFNETDSGYFHKYIWGLKPHKPFKYSFDGDVYFLINGQCGSATSILLSLAHHHQRGIFIGEESGGTYEHVCGYQIMSFELPHSGIRVWMPLMHSKLNTTNGIHLEGVIPDFEVKPGLEDILSGDDPVMDFTRKLIEKDRTTGSSVRQGSG